MSTRDFCYWLQGYFEINGGTELLQPGLLSSDKVKIIKNHLALVFKHDIDKQYKEGDGSQEVHAGLPSSLPVKNTLVRC